jgi:group I intron endonuclease
VYVGSSATLNKRLKEHKTLLSKGAHHCIHLQRAWSKYGSAAFRIDVVESVSPDQLLDREQRWIDAFEPYMRFNTALIAGAPMKGRTHTKERKMKWSRQRTGNGNSFFDRKHKAESLAAMKATLSIVMSGQNNPMYRKHYTAETNAQISMTKTGQKQTADQVRKKAGRYVITTPEGRLEEIVNLRQYCRENGLNQGNMNQVAIGKKKHCKGYKVTKLEAA